MQVVMQLHTHLLPTRPPAPSACHQLGGGPPPYVEAVGSSEEAVGKQMQAVTTGVSGIVDTVQQVRARGAGLSRHARLVRPRRHRYTAGPAQRSSPRPCPSAGAVHLRVQVHVGPVADPAPHLHAAVRAGQQARGCVCRGHAQVRRPAGGGAHATRWWWWRQGGGGGGGGGGGAARLPRAIPAGHLCRGVHAIAHASSAPASTPASTPCQVLAEDGASNVRWLRLDASTLKQQLVEACDGWLAAFQGLLATTVMHQLGGLEQELGRLTAALAGTGGPRRHCAGR